MQRATIALLAGLCAAAIAPRPGRCATLKWTQPYPGVRHLLYVDSVAPVRVNLLVVDVTSQEIHLRATPPGERGRTVSDFATCAGAPQGCVKSEIAVNGDLFDPLGFVPLNLAIGDRTVWPDATKDSGDEGWLAFGRPQNNLNQVALQYPEVVGGPPKSLDADGVVSGRPLLLRDGIPQTQFDCTDASDPCREAPRTAVGLDQLGTTLYVAVVDGDQPGSVGMSAAELGAFLADQGAWDALALDHGGASAMYIAGEGGLVSKPSDGAERPVANHLGIHYGQLPHCTVVGFVFDKVIGGTKLNNATVSLDGRLGAWDTTHTFFNFPDVEPHYTCVVASAPGYKTGQQCKQITLADIMQNTTQYDSVALQPGTNPPDMAMRTDLAMGPRDLGRAPRDFEYLDDGGGDMGPETIGSGCSCQVARGRSSTGAVAFLGLFAMLWGIRARARRKTRERHS